MKFRVLGTFENGRRFDIEVFAACAREAEVIVTLRCRCQGYVPSVAGVLDVARQSVLCQDLSRPALQEFEAMLWELHDVMRAGKVSFGGCREYQWLRESLESGCVDGQFFDHCENRMARIEHLPDAHYEAQPAESLIRLAAIGVSLLESRSVPNTQNLSDLMWQVRASAFLYGPVLQSGFNRPALRVVDGRHG